MKVSKNQLLSYAIASDLYFPTRTERDNYFIGKTIEDGTYIAVAEDPNVDQSDMSSPIWYLEQYNGVNWTLASIDDSFALVVTNNGLQALTWAQDHLGEYKLAISRVVLRKVPLSAGTNFINLTDNQFRYNASVPGNNPNLTILDTGDSDVNITFSLNHNVSYRINSANSGIQYIISLDTDTIGLDYANMTSLSEPIPLYEFDVGAIGLYVRDQNNEEVLFATANIPNSIYKFGTTATRTGNTVKLYLNTTLSNLGYVSDLTVMPEDRGSLPEVVSESDLDPAWNAKTTPHNVYLVDNLYDTGVPALAVRTGDPVANETIEWTYFTPNSNSLKVDASKIHSSVQDYMAVYFDESSGKYKPATGSSKTQGIKVGDSIIYGGQIVNNNSPYKYKITIANVGSGYKVGDSFTLTKDNMIFTILVTEVTAQGAINKITYSPQYGSISVSGTNLIPEANGTEVTGSNFKVTLNSEAISNIYAWNFSNSWYNKPLYVSDTNAGKFTTTVTETFIGWCVGTGPEHSAIKLSIDLQTKATESVYGLVRYATDNEVKTGNSTSGENSTVVTPEKLQLHYFQKDLVSGEPGESTSNPVVVDAHTKFTKTIVGTGSNVDGVSFKGTAYRALWADLAEIYRADQLYIPGTLITIGAGLAEITEATTECNGIISTKPGYILGEKTSDYDLPVALVGKVPVRFSNDSNPQFGDKIYLSKTEPGKASVIPNGKCLGKIIDKDKDLAKKSTIMCSIRINF